MDEFPGNSRRPRKEEPEERSREKKIAKVVQSEVVRRKKPLNRRLREMIIGDDQTSVSEFLLVEVIVPNIKDLIYDVVNMGVERRLYGEGARPRRGHYGGSRGRGASHTPYDRISRGRDDRPQLSRQARARHDFGEIVIDSRAEAMEVLDSMYDLLEKYEQVTVGNLLELVGESSNYTDERYGWTDLQGSGVRRVPGGGFLLDLPRTEDLER
jgi:hypothetical protein